MVDNYNDTLNAIRRFIYANAPAGIDRDRLERLLEGQTHYFPLEFRRERCSVTLYIEIDSFAGASALDERGDKYRACKLSVQPSWPSYGSVDLDQAREFHRLLEEILIFANALSVTFDKPIVKLVETAEQAAERKLMADEENARARVRALMRANLKGMRVGQERRVEAEGPDFLPLGRVMVEATGTDGTVRRYTTNVTATRAFYFMRVA